MSIDRHQQVPSLFFSKTLINDVVLDIEVV